MPGPLPGHRIHLRERPTGTIKLSMVRRISERVVVTAAPTYLMVGRKISGSVAVRFQDA